ncbi:hypothetical protein FOPG_15769 [Fusarium oxysporum f. sp. conglutinans race 2 54008]|uniref:Uncharacterized protein n=2 Tax=Fusarium oxysporum TaxID=5507 RepID=X0I4F2_FUSOX|nr:hypothetical protein FOVG_13264 [Fusarium oxysporum f. sp. pisi HDV247]EXL68164.1 hypothetical protein FOPG_15769 [Fusarium oxysporum f. sp. conglutinans race 2 54008]
MSEASVKATTTVDLLAIGVKGRSEWTGIFTVWPLT